MKRNLLAVAAVVVAIGFSAFTTAKSKFSVIYYQTSTDFYEKLTSTAGKSCLTNATHACTITYETDPGVQNFNYSSKPSGGSESATTKLFLAD